MTRRHALPAIVLLALSLALAGAATARVPHRLPAVSLASVLVWRVELAAVVFSSLYSVVVVTRLALHGETLTRVGRDGIEIPRVGSAPSDDPEAGESLAARIRELEQLSAGVDRAAGSNPRDVLLRHDQEAT